jgi:hypothetical protein
VGPPAGIVRAAAPSPTRSNAANKRKTFNDMTPVGWNKSAGLHLIRVMTNHDQETVLRATADVRRILRDPTPVLRLAPWIGSLPKWKGVNLCAQLVEWTAAEYCGSLIDVRRSRANGIVR